MIAGNNQPALAVFKSWSAVPENLHTRNQWKKRQRQVRKGEKPTALVEWHEAVTCESERIDTDGSITTWNRQVPMKRQAALFTEGQTASYKPTVRTSATVVFRHRFIDSASREKYIWWCGQPLDSAEKPGWRTCDGPLKDWHLKKHLKGDEKYGVRGDVWTNFGGIDHDLHDGDPDIFLEQFRVLLGEFHAKDGWHFQVAEKDAGGVHFYQTFRNAVMVAAYRERLRKRLQELHQRHPELAAKARAAGMKTLADLEIFPDPEKGIRLPLCGGRIMLLDRPLGLVFNKRSQRWVQDVVGYVAWLLKADKTYMPAEDVFEFVKQRLKAKRPVSEAEEATGPPPKKDNSKKPPSAGKLGSLGKMKGRCDKVLVDFWTGRNNPPDTLNDGIRLLALVLPFFGKSEAEAIDLIEDYIDALPDWTFSDRLSSGNRAEVSRVVKNTVRQAFHGNGGQPDPATSTTKLLATAQAWKRKGFDPTDQTTWNTPAPNRTIAPR
jgi:hypothetical protein